MTRSPRSSTSASVPPYRRAALRRGLGFRGTNAPPGLVRERLDSLTAAFLADARPGLIFEYGRLVFANDAARQLLGSVAASDEFLSALKASVDAGMIQPGLLLRSRSGVYAPVLHPARSRRGHPTRICFLVEWREAAPVCEDLSDRELEVVRLLVKGFTNQQIADGLGISIETVRKHVSKALEKTGTKTRAGLVARALGR
jgi:DNA-binding CsgD family transcriptional regulator